MEPLEPLYSPYFTATEDEMKDYYRLAMIAWAISSY